MRHLPITESKSGAEKLEFSHFNERASKGHWKKEKIISLESIKINVFIEGEYCVYSDGVSHQPVYGDVAFFAPHKLHYGHIQKETLIHYYQLDVGIKAFSSIPGGETLILKLIELASERASFFRPNEENRDKILNLLRQIEGAIKKDEMFLAFLKSAEFVFELYDIYYYSPRIGSSSYSLRTTQAIRFIENNFSEDISVKSISAELGISPSYLERVFKREVGTSPHSYLNRYRLLRACELLLENTVTQTALLCGFCDSSHFISVFKNYMGQTPMQYLSGIK